LRPFDQRAEDSNPLKQAGAHRTEASAIAACCKSPLFVKVREEYYRSMKKSSAEIEPKNNVAASVATPRTLAVDVGGTGVKAIVLDPAGQPLTERTKIPTPKAAKPKDLIAVITKLAEAQGEFERVSVGFPGVIKEGIVYTAANLGTGWKGFNLRKEVEEALKRPTRVANDADIQGLGAIEGHGVEMVITLGTGFGSVIFTDGRPIHLELGHHPFRKGKTYEEELGERALKRKGRKKWLKLLNDALDDLARTFYYDQLYIGGGNARVIDFKLPDNVKVISNLEGLLGGIALWKDEPAISQPINAKHKPSTSRAARTERSSEAPSGDHGNGADNPSA
jgi:polyphosphate glucokinase